MYSKKMFTENFDDFDEFMSTDFSKRSLDKKIELDIQRQKYPEVSQFWNDDSDSSEINGKKIGTGKSFLKPKKSSPPEPEKKSIKDSDSIPEITVQSDSSKTELTSGLNMKLNLPQSTDKSITLTYNDETLKPDDTSGMKDIGFPHPVTFEGITDPVYQISRSAFKENDTGGRSIRKYMNGIDTMKSSMTNLPIDESIDTLQKSWDNTRKEHLLSKVSLLDSYEDHKIVNQSMLDTQNSKDTINERNPIFDRTSNSYNRMSLNPASGDSFNVTQGITNITDTVIGENTAADLAALHRHLESKGKESIDMTHDSNVQITETVKEVINEINDFPNDSSSSDSKSFMNNAGFGTKVMRIEDLESPTPTPTPRPRNKKLPENEQKTKDAMFQRQSGSNISNIKNVERPHSNRYAHVKSSGYGTKPTTPSPQAIAEKSKLPLKKSGGNKFGKNSRNIQTRNEVSYPRNIVQAKSDDRDIQKYNLSQNTSNRSLPMNQTYKIKRHSDDEFQNMFSNIVDGKNISDRRSQEWQEKWLEERKLVKKLQANSEMQERDFKKQVERVAQQYEEKVSQLEVELSRAKQFQSKSDLTNKIIGSNVSKDDIEKIQNEIKEQEAIIVAYQKDNERLYNEIKVLKQNRKSEDRLDIVENERLISQIASLKAEMDSKEIELRNLKKMYRENKIMGGGSNILENQILLDEIANLKTELQTLNSKYLASESERQKAEARLDRIVSDNDKTINSLQNEIDVEKVEKEKLKEEHLIQINELKKKLKWYLENQAILDQDSKKIKMKDKQISDLKRQLENSEHVKISSNIRAKEKLADAAKIKELADENVSLKGELYALIKGKNIGNVAEKRTIQFLETRIKSLEEQLDMAACKEDKSLRSLQQQFDIVKDKYEEEIRDLEYDLAKNGDTRLDSEKKIRIKDLNLKIENLNKDLKKKSEINNQLKMKLKRSGSKQNVNSNECLNPQIEFLRKELHRKDTELQLLQAQFSSNKAKNEIEQCLPENLELQAENVRLKSQLVHVNRSIEADQRLIEDLENKLITQEKVLRDSFDKEMKRLDEYHRENLKNVKLDFAGRHGESDVAYFQSQMEMQKNYINHMQSQIADLSVKVRDYEIKEKELQESRSQIQTMKTELMDLRLIWSQKPGLEMIERLRSKIIQLEEKESSKLQTFDNYIEKSVKTRTKHYEEEIDKWRSMVSQKNQKLLHVQHEVNQLLEALEELRRQGISIPMFSKASDLKINL